MIEIAFVNTDLPFEDTIDFSAKKSLADYDVVFFDPSMPFYQRIEFSGGGSCIDIAGTKRFREAQNHWRKELSEALAAGKTVFVLMSTHQRDQGATGSSTPRKGQRLYDTVTLNNYDALPVSVSVRNSVGQQMIVEDRNFRSLFAAIQDFCEYKVVFEGVESGEAAFLTKDRKRALGIVRRVSSNKGRLVLLPSFEFPDALFNYKKDEWHPEAKSAIKRIVSEFVAFHRSHESQGDSSPTPAWMESVRLPNRVAAIDQEIRQIEASIASLISDKELLADERRDLQRFGGLLFEQGKHLELAVSMALKELGYVVENYVDGDTEIDHVLVSPTGTRLIGETEGKDTSAIGIAKFRQLESNINEDFDRDEVEEPAMGIIFGNAFRITEPSSREGDFTEKCMKNAKRLGTALVRTRDLYEVVVHLTNSPDDDEFRKACRNALETAKGEVVIFPKVDQADLS